VYRRGLVAAAAPNERTLDDRRDLEGAEVERVRGRGVVPRAADGLADEQACSGSRAVVSKMETPSDRQESRESLPSRDSR
jgi:hypothetical protein